MDKTLQCIDCGSDFVFSESEQEFFKKNDFTDPKRCKNCRAKKKAQRPNR